MQNKIKILINNPQKRRLSLYVIIVSISFSVIILLANDGFWKILESGEKSLSEKEDDGF